ncbi:hypothetical protein ACIQCJ_02220 [Streptomyces sp. NPDC093221]|uniref:hypothetical protein n=1 Tax=Streptomyces sp. NPDC093221 TaxID=3366032 RepID=UPI0037F76F92
MDSNEYDEYEAIVRVPKGARLARSRKTEGAHRGITDPGTDQMGNAELFLKEQNGPNPVAAHPQDWPDFDHYESEVRAQERRENAEFVAEVLVQVSLRLAEKAAPHLRKWWFEHALPAVKMKWNDRATLSVKAKWSSVTRGRQSDRRPEVEGGLQEAVVVPDDQRRTMSSAEAQKRFKAAVVTRLLSDGQLRLVCDARVVDEEEDGPVELGATSDLTPQLIGERIALVLEANSSLLGQDTLVELGRLVAEVRANVDDLVRPAVEGARPHDDGNGRGRPWLT